MRLDKAAATVAVQVEKLKAEDKLYTLGKDNLARISSIMMRLALLYSPEEKDEKGEPCRPYWPNTADEMRFLRLMGLAYDCDKARAPYESPRITPAPEQTQVDDDDGDDPHESLMRIIEGWIEADKAEKAAKMIDVTHRPGPWRLRPSPIPTTKALMESWRDGLSVLAKVRLLDSGPARADSRRS